MKRNILYYIISGLLLTLFLFVHNHVMAEDRECLDAQCEVCITGNCVAMGVSAGSVVKTMPGILIIGEIWPVEVSNEESVRVGRKTTGEMRSNPSNDNGISEIAIKSSAEGAPHPEGEANYPSLEDLLPELAGAGGQGVGEGEGAGSGQGRGGEGGGSGIDLSGGQDYWERNPPPADCSGMITVGVGGGETDVRVSAGGGDECWGQFWDNLGETPERVGQFFSDLGSGFVGLMEGIGNFFSDIGSSILGFFGREDTPPVQPLGVPFNPGVPFGRLYPVRGGSYDRPIAIHDNGIRVGDGSKLSSSIPNNGSAQSRIAGGDSRATNPVTGDPVDPVSGALTLEEPLVSALSLHYNHQRRTQVSLFGAGWDITGNEVLYTTEEKAIKYEDYRVNGQGYWRNFSPQERDCGVLIYKIPNIIHVTPVNFSRLGKNERIGGIEGQVVFTSDPHCWGNLMQDYAAGGVFGNGKVFRVAGRPEVLIPFEGEENYPPQIEMLEGRRARQMYLPPNPPLVIENASGAKKYFSGGLTVPTDFCGKLDPTSNACLYMLKDHPDLMRQFIPIGYYLGGDPTVLHNGPSIPTHWLTKIELPGSPTRTALTIDREMTWQGQFVFPGSDRCGRDINCQLQSSIEGTIPGANPQFSNPVPEALTVRYRSPMGNSEVTLRALWRVESEGELGNAMLSHYVPYVVEAWDNHGRHWSFDYAYPATPHGRAGASDNLLDASAEEGGPNENGMCPFDWAHVDRACQEWVEFRGQDLSEIYHPIIYKAPLLLSAIYYPNPETGEATGPVKRFVYDQSSRLKSVTNFSGETGLSVIYDQYNRVLEQRLGGGNAISYRVMDEADEDKTFIDDRALQDGYGHAFTGFEIEITTAGGRRSVVGVEQGGRIRYLREQAQNGIMLETAYEYYTQGEVQGSLYKIYYPDGRIATRILRNGDVANYSGDSINTIEIRHFLTSFQVLEEQVTSGEQTVRTTYEYMAAENYIAAARCGFNFLQAIGDPINRTTNIMYDFEGENRCQTQFGLPEYITYPDGTHERFEYNRKGQVLFHRNRLGAERTFNYYGTGEGCG